MPETVVLPALPPALHEETCPRPAHACPAQVHRCVHIAVALVAVAAALVSMRTHVFDPAVLQRIAQDAVARNGTAEEVIADVIRAMQRTLSV